VKEQLHNAYLTIGASDPSAGPRCHWYLHAELAFAARSRCGFGGPGGLRAGDGPLAVLGIVWRLADITFIGYENPPGVSSETVSKASSRAGPPGKTR
jgi:hypothetical protein